MVHKQAGREGWFRSRGKKVMQAAVDAEGWSSGEICGHRERVQDTQAKLQSTVDNVKIKNVQEGRKGKVATVESGIQRHYVVIILRIAI